MITIKGNTIYLGKIKIAHVWSAKNTWPDKPWGITETEAAPQLPNKGQYGRFARRVQAEETITRAISAWLKKAALTTLEDK